MDLNEVDDHSMGDKFVFENSQNTRLLNIVIYKISDSSHTLTARSGGATNPAFGSVFDD